MTQVKASTRELRRWHPPSLTSKRSEPGLDEAAHALQRFASGVLARLSGVIGECSAASLSSLQRRGYVDIPEIADRAWRIAYDRREIFCVLDEPSERALLTLIIGGAPGRTLSSIERAITSESLRRLFEASADSAQFREDPRARPSVQCWRCELELVGRGRLQATLQLFTDCVSVPQLPATAHPHLNDVPLQLQAILPRTLRPLHEIHAWRPGSLLRYDHQQDITVALYAGSQRVAIGQLGTVVGSRAARLIAVGVKAQ